LFLIIVITLISLENEEIDYKIILVGIDGSEESMRAADHAISIAKKYGSHLLAITVLDIPDIRDLNFDSQRLSRYQLEEYVQKVKNWLLEIRQKAEGKGVMAETELIDEPLRPEKSILHYAKDKKADLIIVGHGKHGNFKELMLGNIALEIVKNADCNVMVIR
jgi:nucleotide-binding universal stress UspA family protein